MIDSSGCRIANVASEVVLPREEFASQACAQCLLFIYFMSSFPLRVKSCNVGLNICQSHHSQEQCNCETPEHVFNLPEYAMTRNSSTPTSELPEDYRTFMEMPSHFETVVRSCCSAALSCCDKVLIGADAESNGHECPATWDGWQCFPRSPVGSVRATCPYYIDGNQGIEEKLGVVKECTVTGWLKNEQGVEYTHYGGCANENKAKFYAGVLSYAISVIALIPAVGILSKFRTLRAAGVYVIHKHLLISFLLLGIFYLFTSFMFIVKDAPLMRWHNENHIVCRLLFLTQLRFLRLSTFSWMLAEGVFLFRLLHKAFSDDSLLVYQIVCWGVPLLVSIVYGALRLQLDDTDCWVTPSADIRLEAIVMFPSLICIMVNLILVTVILYILVMKLRYNPELEPMHYRKAVRAALMLVPVFGLHFLFTIYRVPSDLHQIMNLIMDGLQGFAVSIILCYANTGVGEAVKKYIKDMKDLRTVGSQCRTSSAGLGKIPSAKKKISMQECVQEGQRESQDYRQPLMTTTEEPIETNENSM